MVRLNSPRREIFIRNDFETYPVWTWDDQNEGYLPISEAEPSPGDYWGLFIKAHFQTSKGFSFEGFLVGDEFFHAFGLFVKDELIVINFNLLDELDEDLKKIYELLKCEPFDLFPLRYESSVRFKGGKKISGLFMPKGT